MILCDFLNVFRYFVNVNIVVSNDEQLDSIFEGSVSEFDTLLFDYDCNYWSRKVLKVWIKNEKLVILID